MWKSTAPLEPFSLTELVEERTVALQKFVTDWQEQQQRLTESTVYSLLRFFVSHLHFLILYIHVEWTAWAFRDECSCPGQKARTQTCQKRRKPSSPFGSELWQVSLWPKPALPTQQTKSKIAGSEQGQMLSESCHYTTESHHLRRPLDCRAGMLLQSTWYSGLSAFQQLQPKHEVLWQLHQKFFFFFFHRQHNRNGTKYWQSSRITSIKS